MQSFNRGSRWTEEATNEYDRLVARVAELERDNASLRAQVEQDDAIRELLGRIQNLEQEKQQLLSRVQQVEENGGRFGDSFQVVESEFSDLVSLYVASSQLHTL